VCTISALPITIIVDNFIKVAQEEQQTEQFKAELLAMEEQESQVQQEQEQLRQKYNNNKQQKGGFGKKDKKKHHDGQDNKQALPRCPTTAPSTSSIAPCSYGIKQKIEKFNE
jgi:seryl-tRNA synthetase